MDRNGLGHGAANGVTDMLAKAAAIAALTSGVLATTSNPGYMSPSGPPEPAKVTVEPGNGRRKPIVLTVVQAKERLTETRKRAEGWRAGSASLVALIVASLALRSTNGWMSSFTGPQLYLISGLVAVGLLLASVSMWLTLRAANGPARDYEIHDDATGYFTSAKAAARDLCFGQVLLWSGVVVFCVAAFASWLLDPQGDGFWTLR